MDNEYVTQDTNLAAFLIVKGVRMLKQVRSHEVETVSFTFDGATVGGLLTEELAGEYLYRRAECPAREFAEVYKTLRKEIGDMIRGGIYEK